MRNCCLPAGRIVVFGLFIGVCLVGAAAAQTPAGRRSSLPDEKAISEPRTKVIDSDRLTDEQLEAIASPDVRTCEGVKTVTTTSGRISSSRINPNTIIPRRHARKISEKRVAKTLHGIWRGQVVGDHGEINVDYFWILDTKRNEGLIIAQRSGVVTLSDAPPLENAPRISYLMCGHDGYLPDVSVPQVHVFTKVSNDTADAVRIVEKATGQKFFNGQTGLTDIWDVLVKNKYFDSLRFTAFGGGLFAPLQIERSRADNGLKEILIGWDAQYRGGGATLLEFTESVPMVGVERGRFVGMSAPSGDYLVASPGNGALWKVEVFEGGSYDLAFDSTTIGPLQ